MNNRILELIEKAQKAKPKKPVKWAHYKPLWKALEGEGFQPTEAAKWIGEEENLNQSDIKKLINQIARWRELENAK